MDETAISPETQALLNSITATKTIKELSDLNVTSNGTLATNKETSDAFTAQKESLLDALVSANASKGVVAWIDVIGHTGEIISGCLRNPNRVIKRQAINEFMKNPGAPTLEVGRIYLEGALIQDAACTDPRLYSALPENDDIAMSIELACISKVQILQADLKKK